MTDETSTDLLTLTAEIVSSHVSNNTVATEEIAALIASVHQALGALGKPSVEAAPDRPVGQVSIRKSVADPAHILSMIDGKPYAMLRRHIRRHGYTPESYRETFGLPRDYPLVAPAHSARRREAALKIGLGGKAKSAVSPPTPAKVRARVRHDVPATSGTDDASAPRKRGRSAGAISDAIASARKHLTRE